MQRRRNAGREKKPQQPSHFPRYKENIGVCIHVERELYAEQDIKEDPEHEAELFEDQFSKLTIIESRDGIYRLYLLCPQCRPKSLEDFYLEQYPDLVESAMVPKGHYKRVLSWIATKEIELLPLRLLFRTHALGSAPQIGNHVHICEHASDLHVAYIISTSDDEIDIQVLSGNKKLQQPTHLVLCPDCIADFDPGEMYEYIIPKTWNKKNEKWLSSCHTIYEAAGEFFEKLYEKLEDAAEDLEEYSYEGPALGEQILLCDHLQPGTLVEDADIEYLNEDNTPYKIPKTKKVVMWIAACEECTEETNSPLHAAQKRCKRKRLHTWNEIDQVKLCIAEIGSEFTFSTGLMVEALANAICEELQRPEWFFDQESPAWRLSREWAPIFFETTIAVATQATEDEIRQGHSQGELWEVSLEKHPTTHEESIIRENKAITLHDFDFVVIVTAPYETTKLPADEMAGLELEIRETEEFLDMLAQNEGGVKFQIVTIPGRGWREFHYLFSNKFAAEAMDNGIDDQDVEVDILEIEKED